MEHHYEQSEFSANGVDNFAANYSNFVPNEEDMQSEYKASTSNVIPKIVAPKRSASGNCQFCKDKQISSANWCRHLRRKHPEVLGLAPSRNVCSTRKLETASTTSRGCSSASIPKRKSEIWKYLQYFPEDKCIECHKEMRNLSPWNAKRHLIKKHPEALEKYGLAMDKEVPDSHPSTFEHLLALTEESCSSQGRLENGFHFSNGEQNNIPETNCLSTTNWETAKLDRYKAETTKISLECEKLHLEKSLLETELRLRTVELRLAEQKLGDEATLKVIAEADTRNRVAEARLKELQVREMEIKLGLFR